MNAIRAYDHTAAFEQPGPHTAARFVWALLASLAIHAFLLFGPHIQFNLPKPLPDHLDVTLALPEEAPKVVPKPRQVKHHAKPHPAKPKMAPASPPPKVAKAQPSPSPIPESTPEPMATPPIQPAPPVEPEPAPPEPPPKPALSNPLPLDAQIEFALNKGEGGLTVGRVTLNLKVQGDNYTLSSVTEATGIFSLIKSGRLVQTSQGKLTDDGLRPDSFWIQRGQSVDTTESATFNWETHSLSLSSKEEQRTYNLPDQTEDLLSFPFQLALLAKNNLPLKVSITNGRKLDNYEYRIVGNETLSINQSTIHALHLAKVQQPGDDGTDIWLSLDHNYLPVKIRVTDKKGNIAEQIAVNITAAPGH